MAVTWAIQLLGGSVVARSPEAKWRIWRTVAGATASPTASAATNRTCGGPKKRGMPWHVDVGNMMRLHVFREEQSAIPQLRSHDSRTKTTRFHNQTTRFRSQNRRASTTTFSRFHNQNPTIPQPKSHDSTTKLPRFHNQNLRIPQPKSQDSTTKISGFHNQTLRIPRFFGKTTATYFHYKRFLTRYKILKNSPPPQNYTSNLSIQQAVLYGFVQIPFGFGITRFGYGIMVGWGIIRFG